MTRPMTPKKKQTRLKVVANTVGFGYLMYLPGSLLRRPGLLYKRKRYSRDKIEIRCAIVREAFVKAVSTMVIDSCSNDGIDSFSADIVVGVGQQ